MPFAVGDTVTVKDRGDVYLGSIKKVDPDKGCFIHFNGWSARHDRWENESALTSSAKAESREQERKRTKKAKIEEQEKKRAKKAAESSARVYMDQFRLGPTAAIAEQAAQFHEQGLVHFQVPKITNNLKTVSDRLLFPFSGSLEGKCGGCGSGCLRSMVPARVEGLRHPWHQ